MIMYKKTAKAISYAPVKRSRAAVKYIVIHYTGGTTDTAKNNADYFANGNSRYAGAHFFVDKKGKVARSIPMNRSAYAVGGDKYADCKKTGGGKYFGKCTNFNSVSIELAASTVKEPYSEKQAQAVKKLVKYIQKYCPNAKTIIRHFDVTGKQCPAGLIDEKKWHKFKSKIK